MTRRAPELRIRLVKPSLARLPDYIAALQRRWSPDNVMAARRRWSSSPKPPTRLRFGVPRGILHGYGRGASSRVACFRKAATIDKDGTMKRTATALLFGLAMLAMGPGLAQDKPPEMTDMQALRKALNTDKRALVESMLNLTPAEAKSFWPVYEAYQRSLDATDRRRTVALEALVARDRPVSDLYARNMAIDLISADEAEVKARRTLHNRILRALPARKAARYLQFEAKVRALQAYDIAVMFPLVR